MMDKKIRKMSIELNPVQMVWLHSQHLFQKIQQSTYLSRNEIKFFKNNNGVEIKFQHFQQNPDFQLLAHARDQLMKVISSNQIRLINTSLHKDLYIKISKEARKEFPKCYIIFLHYETFENCCRKLQEKFGINSIMPEMERLRKLNPNFCFLIAEKQKIDDIQKFTTRILNSEVSCASTTFSQHTKRQIVTPSYKKTMSVSSLKGSFSDQNEDQCRLSLHPTVTQEQMFQVSEVTLVNLSQKQMDLVSRKRMYQGSSVYVQKQEGIYSNVQKKLYYANRLQLTANPYIQPIYAYSMIQKSTYRWCLALVTDRKYKKLSDQWNSPWLANTPSKIDLLLKVGKGLHELHTARQSYGDLNDTNVLIDEHKCVYLSCIINKDVPPHTDPFQFDLRRYLMLIYRAFTQIDISYELIVLKQQKQEFFCSMSHKAKLQITRNFLDLSDRLFIKEISLAEFLKKGNELLKQFS